MSELLGSRQRPTAVIAGGIDMLSGVLKAIRLRGLAVPRDISVVGTGDSSLAELYDPPISVERWDQGEVGRVAAGLLLDRISGHAPRAPRHVLLPTEFVLRQSTAPPG
jgi:LacI family transcriptional regulator